MATVGGILRKSTLERLDTELLLAFVLGKDRSFILAHPEARLTSRVYKKFKDLAIRRKKHEPMAYILGEKEFYGHQFLVNRFTLIPRPETELLVEKSIEIIEKKLKEKKKGKIAVIDVGTGSGAIIVSVAAHFQKKSSRITFFATDISKRALLVAKKNALLNNLKDISFSHGNLLEPLIPRFRKFDCVILLANLPYLSEKLHASTPLDVRKFEPKKALLSGKDGLDHYRELFNQISTFQGSQRIDFFLEISPEQQNLDLSFLPTGYRIFPDLTGLSRLIMDSL